MTDKHEELAARCEAADGPFPHTRRAWKRLREAWRTWRLANQSHKAFQRFMRHRSLVIEHIVQRDNAYEEWVRLTTILAYRPEPKP